MSEYQVVNPATGEVEREFDTATDAEIQDVLTRSHAAYGAWKTTDKGERTKMLLRVADLYDERRDELAAIIAREMGKRIAEAKGELKPGRLDLPLLRRAGAGAPGRHPAQPGHGR